MHLHQSGLLNRCWKQDVGVLQALGGAAADRRLGEELPGRHGNGAGAREEGAGVQWEGGLHMQLRGRAGLGQRDTVERTGGRGLDTLDTLRTYIRIQFRGSPHTSQNSSVLRTVRVQKKCP